MSSLRTFTFYEGSGYLGYNYSGFRADAGWIRPPALAVGSLLANASLHFSGNFFRYTSSSACADSCRPVIMLGITISRPLVVHN